MRQILLLPSLLIPSLLLGACSPATSTEPPKADMKTPLRVFETLSSDAMQGRNTGTEGALKAQAFLRDEISKMDAFDIVEEFNFGVTPWKKVSAETPWEKDLEAPKLKAINFNALIDIEDNDEGPLFVITAHYDHLGIDGDKVYNGADDNASGSAALFAIAQSFAVAPPEHDVLFIWLDAEEKRLAGSRAYLSAIDNFSGRPAFNLNLDMVSQNETELYMAGTHHLPAIKPLLELAANDTGITLSFGHDRPEDGQNDWTLQSDHGAFHEVGIPFVYFGVEDHPHYHQPSDTFDKVPLGFYEGSVQTIINAAHILDENLKDLARPASQ